jgi:superfamily II DNA or RNA helicase
MTTRAPIELRPWSQPLRAWQRDGVARWARAQPATWLAVVTPGAGKSLFSAAIAYGALAGHLVDGILVVVPSDHLRFQMASTFASEGIQLDPRFRNAQVSYSRDFHGVVVTIHQVAQDPAIFQSLVQRRRMLVVIDEVHHAGSNERWGRAVETAFASARHVVALSGTPFRSDGTGISFLSYDAEGRVEADVVYGYRDGLHDGIVRPVVFARQGAEVTWTAADGSPQAATFDDLLDKQRSSERLRAALTDRAWVSEVLLRADSVLRETRRHDPSAGGLVVCMDEKHARWVAEVMAEVVRVRPTVVVSADLTSGANISRFTRSRDPWLCAVRMVSEGVDIPRARVLAYLSNVKTELFFRQLIGRVVRSSNGSGIASFVLLPDDPDLRTFASEIEADVDASRSDKPVGGTAPREQGYNESQFEGHNSVHLDRGTIVGDACAAALGPVSHADVAQSATWGEVAETNVQHAVLADRKIAVRRQLWVKVNEVARRFNKEPAEVYRYWKRRDGASVASATEQQLERRLEAMERWELQQFCPV